ncbi:MAG: FecR family protein [Planctomycetota bacterium]
MSRASDNAESRALWELASAVMEGTATETQRRELTARLRDSETMRDEYLAFVDLHAVLNTELSVMPSTSSTAQEPTRLVADQELSLRKTWQRRRIGLAAVAASLLVAGGFWGLATSLEREDMLQVSPRFATIAQLTNATWSGDSLSLGERIGPASLRIETGFARVEFDSGVEVTLEGPAEFTLVNETLAKLSRGILTATVPPGAERFQVNTPHAEVVDLGTSFGIELQDGGVSNVSVFDGEVEVGIREREEKRLVAEGESVSVNDQEVIESIGFDLAPFSKLWPVASGIVGSSESIRFAPPWPPQIRFVQSNEDIFIAVENRRTTLREPLAVNAALPGTYVEIADLTPAEIRPGETVRSYILHHSPSRKRGPLRAKRVKGSVTFDRPVLGVILRSEELRASSRLFSRRGFGENNPRRELQLTGNNDGDRITLSEDRRTISVDLIAPGMSSDLLRVIVEKPRARGARRRG